ncbi:MAG: hypothetical protein E6Q95_06080 [Chitinophagaceae bacterium]|nr:MAG: hypothetical protein E6Q95_06080 [Chitinophagaceae bacterium]
MKKLTRADLKNVMGGAVDLPGMNNPDTCSTVCKCPAGFIVRDGVVALPEIFVYPCTVCEISVGNWFKCSGVQYNCSFTVSTYCIPFNG